MRDFAKSTGQLAKTDSVDALMLAEMAQLFHPLLRRYKKLEPWRKTQQAWVKRRLQVIRMIGAQRAQNRFLQDVVATWGCPCSFNIFKLFPFSGNRGTPSSKSISSAQPTINGGLLGKCLVYVSIWIDPESPACARTSFKSRSTFDLPELFLPMKILIFENLSKYAGLAPKLR